MHTFIRASIQLLSIILILCFITFSSESYAQNGLTVFDEIGGGSGNTSSQSDDSGDDTFLYVAGGVIIAGILVYALVINKDKKKTEDTTATTESNLIFSEVRGYRSYEQEIEKVKEKIPVDVFMGIRNNQAVLNDKTYLLGLRVKL